ncbi:HNH endonuclease signature motif containing protein [Jiangella asiatica]|uniref:HNH endonuclease n=1 Tax=Jiangella asiatica TaxID=2530372 RepID=A0A4R5CJ08_9ACTN|nr:HNH endonuclease signature motif containing protein [Jiangella asiatica]TDE00249.1 HNH endonuclease [Jiangella asiatica]
MVAQLSSSPVPDGLTLPVGAELAVALEEVDLGVLDDSPVVDVVIAVERQVAHLRALQLRAMAELAARENYASCGGGDDGDAQVPRHSHDPVRAAGSEVSAALAWTPGHADARVALGVELVEDLPATLRALAAGSIDERRAELIATRTRVLDPDARSRVEALVLPAAGGRTLRQLSRDLDRLVIEADAGAAEERRCQGREQRRVQRPAPYGEADGTGMMCLTGPVEDLTALWRALDAAARAARVDGDSRTLDQLRFDIATSLGWTALATGRLGGCGVTPDSGAGAEAGVAAGQRLAARQGRPATVNVTLSLDTLVGTNDDPAWLDGHGWVTAQVGRLIAADATLRRLVTDPVDGRLLDYGRTTYEPPQALVDFVIARDRTCRFPTSDTPAQACDLDHRVSYDDGGVTSEENLEPLVRRFHIDKTLHGWRLESPGLGALVWTSPAGRTYSVAPEAIGSPDKPPPTRFPPAADPDPPPF